MMRAAKVSMVFLALVLSACGAKQQDKGGESKSMEEVKQEAAQLQRPQPGKYTQKVEITKMDVPGMPSEAAEQMKTMMAKAQVQTFCLTQAEADKGYRDMFDDIGKGRECTWSRFEVDGGRLDAQMQCKSGDQGQVAIQLAGTVTARGSDVTAKMAMSGSAAPAGAMNMAMHMTTLRVGDCR